MGTSSSTLLLSSLDRTYLSSRKGKGDECSYHERATLKVPVDEHAHSNIETQQNILNYLTSIQETECSGIPPPPLPPLPGGSSPKNNDTKNPPSPSPLSESASRSQPPQSSTTACDVTDSIAQAATFVSALTNPGPYETALAPFKRLTNLETYDGFRCDIQKQLSPFMIAFHSFWLGTTMIPDGRMKTYAFVTQVVNEDGLLMARFDPEMGSIDGRIHKNLLNGLLQAKVQLAVSTERSKDQLVLECDANGGSWTGNVKYGSVASGNIFGLNYYQSIMERWTMGGEGMYVGANGGNWVCSGTVKYEMNTATGMEDENLVPTGSTSVVKGPNAQVEEKLSSSSLKGKSIFLAQYDPTQNGLGLYYNRVVVPDRVALGAELQCSPPFIGHILGSGQGPGEGDCTVALGTEFQLTRSKMNFSVDGTGRIKSTLEAKLGMAMGSPTITFSADIDHGKDIMKFGYGLSVGG